MAFRNAMVAALLAIGIGMPSLIRIQAAELFAQLPSDTTYDYRNDPFLLQWTFRVEQKQAVTERLPTEEETLLSDWKTRQTRLWESLPAGRFPVNASAYTAAADECGKSDGITASGLKVSEGRTLACPPEYPFGARIRIEGVGVLTCEDRGGAIKGNRFDIYMQTKTDAFTFGRQHLLAEVVR